MSSECFVSAFTDGLELGVPCQQNAFLPVHNRSQSQSLWEQDEVQGMQGHATQLRCSE